jgi:hypothetical protein
MVEAQGIRDGLRDNLHQLQDAKDYVSQQRPGEQRVDPQLMNHAQNWMRAHAWWDPNGSDPDSRMVSRIDAQLVTEGLNPNDADYWTELTERVAEALPDRSQSRGGNGDARTPKKKGKRKASGGPTMSVSGRERPLKKNEVYISSERKEAMIEAGVWEDPELRQRYLKQYAEYDREHATT